MNKFGNELLAIGTEKITMVNLKKWETFTDEKEEEDGEPQLAAVKVGLKNYFIAFLGWLQQGNNPVVSRDSDLANMAWFKC
jgi:hypothetical protein